MLRPLADPSNWVADTADAFRDQARDLAKDIDKAEGRYRTVSSELSRWADVLDGDQGQARSYRDQAQVQQRILDTTSAPVATALPTGGPVELTPIQEAEVRLHEPAEDEIQRLRGRLDGLVADNDQRAWEYGRRIRAALDDDVANNWFDPSRPSCPESPTSSRPWPIGPATWRWRSASSPRLSPCSSPPPTGC